MRINEIVVGRKFNLGNFESMEIRVSISPDPEDSKAEEWEKMIEDVSKKLNEEIKKAAEKLK